MITKDESSPCLDRFPSSLFSWPNLLQEGKKQSDTPALWWIDGDGDEVKWSFQDLAFNSKK